MVVSQEIFQQKLHETYQKIPNVTEITDDIIVLARQKKYDQPFVNVFEATRANNVSLNAKKLQFKQKSVNFLTTQ